MSGHRCQADDQNQCNTFENTVRIKLLAGPGAVYVELCRDHAIEYGAWALWELARRQTVSKEES